MTRSGLRTRRWTRTEYDRAIAIGVLYEDEPIELLAGRLVVAEPQSSRHARAIELAAEALRAVFGAGWRVRVQAPLAVDPDSAPEPDIAVVAGSPRDRPDEHPSTAALVLEVADTSLPLDRSLKAGLYARAGVADYWIVNLIDQQVEVHRGLRRSGRRRGYGTSEIHRAGSTLTPLAAPAARIPVSDLLP